jgi:hypothetical protein
MINLSLSLSLSLSAGRPVEREACYDRCAQAVWRLARLPLHADKTIVLVTHGG